MIQDGWLTKEVYARLVTTGPESLKEALWLWLNAEGLRPVPFHWSLYAFFYQIGYAVLSLMQRVIAKARGESEARDGL